MAKKKARKPDKRLHGAPQLDAFTGERATWRELGELATRVRRRGDVQTALMISELIVARWPRSDRQRDLRLDWIKDQRGVKGANERAGFRIRWLIGNLLERLKIPDLPLPEWKATYFERADGTWYTRGMSLSWMIAHTVIESPPIREPFAARPRTRRARNEEIKKAARKIEKAACKIDELIRRWKRFGPEAADGVSDIVKEIALACSKAVGLKGKKWFEADRKRADRPMKLADKEKVVRPEIPRP